MWPRRLCACDQGVDGSVVLFALRYRSSTNDQSLQRSSSPSLRARSPCRQSIAAACPWRSRASIAPWRSLLQPASDGASMAPHSRARPAALGSGRTGCTGWQLPAAAVLLAIKRKATTPTSRVVVLSTMPVNQACRQFNLLAALHQSQAVASDALRPIKKPRLCGRSLLVLDQFVDSGLLRFGEAAESLSRFVRLAWGRA